MDGLYHVLKTTPIAVHRLYLSGSQFILKMRFHRFQLLLFLTGVRKLQFV